MFNNKFGNNQGSRFGGGGRGGDRGDRGERGDRGRGSERAEMHPANCADCGRSCEVPFRPTGSRPVFCRDCFREQNQGDSRGDSRGESRSRDFGDRQPERSSDRRSFDDKPSFQAECALCGEECSVPFKPVNGRPIYCRNCKGKKDASPEDRGVVLSQAQYEILNNKMDKILKMLQGTPVHTFKKEDMAVKAVKEEAVAAEKPVPAKIEKVAKVAKVEKVAKVAKVAKPEKVKKVKVTQKKAK